MAQITKEVLNRLLRGIATQDVETVRQTWRELLNERNAATPFVCELLNTDAWREEPRGPSVRYLGVLLALLHEVNSDVFKEEIERLRGEPIHPLHQHTVEVMAKRRGDRVFGRICGNVPVYISREIDEPDLVFGYLQLWSKTRDLDFLKVTRVDIIKLRPEMDYLGKYSLFYGSIILTWKNDASSGLARLYRRLRTELTFYHEVGHHHYQHSEAGQIEEQEQEANDYMRRMFRNAHPILVICGRVVLFPIFLVMKFSKHLKKKRGDNLT